MESRRKDRRPGVSAPTSGGEAPAAPAVPFAPRVPRGLAALALAAFLAVPGRQAAAQGTVTGSVKTPEGRFAGIGVPVVLTSIDGAVTLRTVTFASPPLNGTAIVPEQGVTSAFSFDGVPPGEYTVALPVSAVQGEMRAAPVTVSQSHPAHVELTTVYPRWLESTPDPARSDPLTGVALNPRWRVAEIGAHTVTSSVLQEPSGLSVFADGGGWSRDGLDDSFTYVYQSGIPQGDWAAYVTLREVSREADPTGKNVQAPNGAAGLMVRSAAGAPGGALLDARAASFSAAVTNGLGIGVQARTADGLPAPLHQETAPGTNPQNPTAPGVQPPLPVTLKIRKVGASFAAFFSVDEGRTQGLIGTCTLQIDPSAELLLGVATTSNTDTLGVGKYLSFVFAPLSGDPPPGVKGDANGNGRLDVLDVLAVLRHLAALAPLSGAGLAAADVDGRPGVSVTDAVAMLRALAGLAALP